MCKSVTQTKENCKKCFEAIVGCAEHDATTCPEPDKLCRDCDKATAAYCTLAECMDKYVAEADLREKIKNLDNRINSLTDEAHRLTREKEACKVELQKLRFNGLTQQEYMKALANTDKVIDGIHIKYNHGGYAVTATCQYGEDTKIVCQSTLYEKDRRFWIEIFTSNKHLNYFINGPKKYHDIIEKVRNICFGLQCFE